MERHLRHRHCGHPVFPLEGQAPVLRLKEDALRLFIQADLKGDVPYRSDGFLCQVVLGVMLSASIGQLDHQPLVLHQIHDVYLPIGTKVNVAMGQKTIGNETVIAKLS